MRLAAAAVGVMIGLYLPLPVYGADPHVHGVATLEIAVDGGVQVNLNSPLDNLLGFERSPRNEKERQAARIMALKLRQADNLFIFTPAAQCGLESVGLESPLLPPGLLMPPSGDSDGKSIHNKGEASKISSPAPSVPTTSSDGHAELEAVWNFKCGAPQALRGLDVRLFEAFPGLRRLDAAIAAPNGQSSAKLSPVSTRLKW